jgi:hypothetical protein
LLVASQGLALAALVGSAVRCSSNTAGNVVGDDSGSGSSSGSSGGASSGDNGSGASSGNMTSGSGGSGTSMSGSSSRSDAGELVIDASADGGCPSQSMATLGAHITAQVSWPSSVASNAGSGTVNIWLLSKQTGDLTFSGTAQSCGTTLPDIDLNTAGAAAVCALGKTCGSKVQIQILNSTWDKITQTFPLKGMQSSWNLGGKISTDKSLGLLGLGQSTTYAMDSTAWPNIPGCTTNCAGVTCSGGKCSGGNGGVFMGSDISDDDGDNKPGITANPLSNSTYSLPPTTVMLFTQPPLADEVYIASRNEIALSATRMTSCTEASGSATISLFDNHVVGCHIQGGSVCDTNQVSFLDSNRTVYGPQPVPSGCKNPCVANSQQPITGTVKIKQLPNNATCADVRAQLP